MLIENTYFILVGKIAFIEYNFYYNWKCQHDSIFTKLLRFQKRWLLMNSWNKISVKNLPNGLAVIEKAIDHSTEWSISLRNLFIINGPRSVCDTDSVKTTLKYIYMCRRQTFSVSILDDIYILHSGICFWILS